MEGSDGVLAKAAALTVDEEIPFPSTAAGYELGAKIGQGAFATVHRAFCPIRKLDVAIKIIGVCVGGSSASVSCHTLRCLTM